MRILGHRGLARALSSYDFRDFANSTEYGVVVLFGSSTRLAQEPR